MLLPGSLAHGGQLSALNLFSIRIQLYAHHAGIALHDVVIVLLHRVILVPRFGDLQAVIVRKIWNVQLRFAQLPSEWAQLVRLVALDDLHYLPGLKLLVRFMSFEVTITVVFLGAVAVRVLLGVPLLVADDSRLFHPALVRLRCLLSRQDACLRTGTPRFRRQRQFYLPRIELRTFVLRLLVVVFALVNLVRNG